MRLVASWGRFGPKSGAVLGPLGSVLRTLGTLLGPLGVLLGPLGAILGPLGTLLEPSCGHLGRLQTQRDEVEQIYKKPLFFTGFGRPEGVQDGPKLVLSWPLEPS